MGDSYPACAAWLCAFLRARPLPPFPLTWPSGRAPVRGSGRSVEAVERSTGRRREDGSAGERATVSKVSDDMCLGVPGRVLEVRGLVALVDFWGVKRETRLDVVDEPVVVGDWILNHVGYAIRKIPAAEIEETLALYDLLLKESEADIMAADVRGELKGTGVARRAPGTAAPGAQGS